MKKKNKAGTFFTPVVAVTGIPYMLQPFLRDTFSELTDLAEIFFQGSYAVQELPF